MTSVPPAPAADSWVDNPNVGNFNPVTKAGQAILEKKTKGLKEENRPTSTNKDSQAIRCFLGGGISGIRKSRYSIPITYDAVGDSTEWGNLLCEYSSISMNILQREAHKRFINPVATVYPLPAAPFTATTIEPANINSD